jgi:hypothetical protein
MDLATSFLGRCTSNFTANDAVKCRNIAGAIAFSFSGNLAKRAGALCHHLGNCTGGAATSSCNVTANAGLDLCSKEGHVGGAVVAGLPAEGEEPIACRREIWEAATASFIATYCAFCWARNGLLYFH